jgi:hypothetical protein
MELVHQTLGDIQNQSATQQETVVEEQPEVVQEETAAESPKLEVNENGQIKEETVAEQVDDAKAKGVEVEDNVASVFNFGDDVAKPAEEAKPATTEQPAAQDWKSILGKVDKKEIYAALGIPEMDDFVIELAKYRANGGDTAKYLEAKAVDYTKIGDSELLRRDFDKKYPQLDAAEKDYLFNKKYVAGEFDEDDATREKSIAMKADAYEVRQRLIAEQQSFKITDVAKPDTQAAQQQQTAIEQEQQRQAQESYQKFMEHDATKSLLTSKRVAVNIGDGSFNFPIDKPEALLKVILDNETWQKVTSNEKGEPDVQKLQRLAMAAINPNYEKDLVNHGRSLERKAQITADQNAKRPTGGAIKTAINQPIQVVSQGTIGSLR